MEPKKGYNIDELRDIYKRYAELKGWGTKQEIIQSKIDDWLADTTGPVELAITFHETGLDHAKHLGYDAEARSRGSAIVELVMHLAGLEYPNSNGTEREHVASQCSNSEFLFLKHEPKNQFDSNAIAVLRMNGEQLGYVPKFYCAAIVSKIKVGFNYLGALNRFTARIPIGASAYQCPDAEIVVFQAAPDVPISEIRAYHTKWCDNRKRQC